MWPGNNEGDNMKTYQPFELGNKSKKKRIKIAKLLLEAFDRM